MIISQALSVRFYRDDPTNQFPTYTNRSYKDLKYANYSENIDYVQYFQPTDTITIQIYDQGATTSALYPKLYIINDNGVQTELVLTRNFDDFFEFDINLTGKSGVHKLFAESHVTNQLNWRSEEFSVKDLTEELSNRDLVKVNWTNTAVSEDYNNFQVSYKHSLMNFCYVKGITKTPTTTSESTEHVEQTGTILLESKIMRAWQFETDPIPYHVCEQLLLAAGHFAFTINNEQYTVAEPSIEDVDGSVTLKTLNMTVTEVSALGLNSNNRGLDGGDAPAIPTANVELMKLTNITTQTTFNLPAGYLIQAIIVSQNPSSTVSFDIRIGETLGAGDIVQYDFGSVGLGTKPQVFTTATYISDTADTTIYVECIGAAGKSADVNILIVKGS